MKITQGKDNSTEVPRRVVASVKELQRMGYHVTIRPTMEAVL